MRFIIFIFLVCVSAKVTGQNLVTNGGFENYTSVPYTYAEICNSSGWLNPSGTCFLIAGTGSPDYYHTSGGGGAAPPNTFWATVMPHTGSAIAGFVTWYGGGSPDYREYVSKQLNAPLVPGVQYEITCWLTNGESMDHDVGSNNLGFYFSNAVPVQNAGAPINVIPQVEMSAVFYDVDWQLVTFYYTATAAYDYVTIGNFRNDANTNTAAFGPSGYGCYLFIDDIKILPSTPLPVELISFSGEALTNSVSLKWVTASETNNDLFEVQHSINGNQFETFQKVNGAGTSSQLNSYSVSHNLPANGINYYRLKQIDFNGAYEYSKIIAVQFNHSGDLATMFLNETTGILFITNKSAEKLYAEIMSIDGRIINTLQSVSDSEFKIDINNLSKGIYLLRVNDKYTIQNFRFVKR